jgi:hypothetical protein
MRCVRTLMRSARFCLGVRVCLQRSQPALLDFALRMLNKLTRSCSEQHDDGCVRDCPSFRGAAALHYRGKRCTQPRQPAGPVLTALHRVPEWQCHRIRDPADNLRLFLSHVYGKVHMAQLPAVTTGRMEVEGRASRVEGNYTDSYQRQLQVGHLGTGLLTTELRLLHPPAWTHWLPVECAAQPVLPAAAAARQPPSLPRQRPPPVQQESQPLVSSSDQNCWQVILQGAKGLSRCTIKCHSPGPWYPCRACVQRN